MTPNVLEWMFEHVLFLVTAFLPVTCDSACTKFDILCKLSTLTTE